MTENNGTEQDGGHRNNAKNNGAHHSSGQDGLATGRSATNGSAANGTREVLSQLHDTNGQTKKSSAKEPKSSRGRRAWLFGNRFSLEEGERMAREERIRDLLPDEDEDEVRKIYDGAMLMRLMRYLTPYKSPIVWAVIAMSISSTLSVAGPWFIGRAIDDGLGGGISAGSLSDLRFWTLAFVLGAIGEWFTNRIRIRLMAYAGTKVVADVRSQLFRHLHTLSLNWHNNYSVGRLMSRLISDVGVLQDFVTWSITGMARSLFIFIGIIVAMFSMSWQLAIVTLLLVPVMVVLTNYWRKQVRDVYRSSRTRLSLINGYLNESISGIRVTKSFSREGKNFQHFDDLNSSYYDANIDLTRLIAIFFPSVDFIGSLTMAMVVAVGGYLVVGTGFGGAGSEATGASDVLTAGILVTFVLYVERFFEPIREMAQRYNTFQATMTGCERIFGLLDTEPDLQDAVSAYALPAVVGQVDFEDVGFFYKDDEPVLRHVNLKAKPGERIAFVGETGAGKSTMIRLIARFFDVSDGALKIDGHDIREVTQHSLRSQMGIVLQDTFLFGGTLADNLRYGQPTATDEEVIAAAKAVGAHDFIMKMENGYETEVGENGVNLSVGQRQLISFARALLTDPRVLILDEATSSVDTATERQIQEALETIMKNRTSFVIAHRLNTIVNSDKIVVMDQGQIVEEGSHAELLAKEGRYYNLYTMQWAAEGDKVTR